MKKNALNIWMVAVSGYGERTGMIQFILAYAPSSKYQGKTLKHS